MAALADGGISILVGTSLGEYSAKGFRMQPSTHVLDFLHTQLTSTWRINTLCWLFMSSPFVIGSVERAQARQKKSFPREWLLIGAAALAVEGISIESAGCCHGACGQRSEPAAYLHDFVLSQITSALAS
jgi:hypothetical protein